MNLHEHNRAKVTELQEYVQAAALQWVAACFQKHLPFKINEAFRSQKRQNDLFNVGRRGIRGERPVTWTRSSVHTKRLAVDIDPIATDGRPLTPAKVRGLLAEIAEVGKAYGIVRPPATLSVGDYRHFEMWGAKEVTGLTEEEEKEKASKEILELTGTIKERAIIRYRKRYGEMPRYT